MKQKIFVISIVTALGLSIIGYYFPRVKAVTIIETFPSASSFSNDFGTEVDTQLSNISFLNSIDSNNDGQEDILAINNDGKGAIIIRSNASYTTFAGLNFNAIPQSQIIEDFTNDNLPDIISLLPEKRAQSMAWRYGKITQVTNNSFAIDTPLRQNILGGSTIIAPNGKQYSVQKNNGPNDEAPANSIFLDKEIGSADSLPAYTTFLSTNQYVAYLLPTQKTIESAQVQVHINRDKNNFASPTCSLYLPKTDQAITALASGDFNGDQKKDLVIISHPRVELPTTRFQATYDSDRRVLTITLTVPNNEFTTSDLRGSYFSFSKYTDQLFKIASNTNNQIVINILIPPSGANVEDLKNAMAAGDSFWLTLNDEANSTNHTYLGNGEGCFTYTGEVKGLIYASNFGHVTLPGADSLADNNRTVITDTSLSLLPVDSFANRQIKIGENTYTIEHNDQGHIYLPPEVGDITGNTRSIASTTAVSTYTIMPLSPAIRVNLDEATQIVSVFREIPNELSTMIDYKPLPEDNPWLRPIDIDDDGDIDIIFIHQNRLFLKLNNERSR